jgi:hypothetical protein
VGRGVIEEDTFDRFLCSETHCPEHEAEGTALARRSARRR